MAIRNSHRERRKRTDNNRVRNRAYRKKHQREGVCAYLKCRGEHCSGGYR